jgi:hypothetical protein
MLSLCLSLSLSLTDASMALASFSHLICGSASESLEGDKDALDTKLMHTLAYCLADCLPETACTGLSLAQCGFTVFRV